MSIDDLIFGDDTSIEGPPLAPEAQPQEEETQEVLEEALPGDLVKSEEEPQEEEVLKEEEPQEEVQKEPPKTLSIGDNELSYDQELTLMTKSGKEANIKVEELVNDYWGKSEVSRKLTEIDRYQKEVLEPKQKVADYVETLVNNLREKADKGDMVEYLFQEVKKLVPESGEAINNFYGYVYDEVDKLKSMSPDQRERYQLEQENMQLKKQSQSSQEQIENKRVDQVISGRLLQIEESYGVSREILKGHYADLVKGGQISDDMPIEQSLDALENVIVVDGYISKARELLSKYNVDDEDTLLDLVNYQMRHGSGKLEARVESLLGHANKAKAKTLKNSKVKGQVLSADNKKPKPSPPKKDTGVKSDPVKEFNKKFGIQSY